MAVDPLARLLIRLAQWLRHPPSPRAVGIMAATILLALAIVLFERLHGWPEWLTVNQGPRVVR